jgi:hypothetical protein
MRYPFLNDPGFNALFFPDTSFHRDFFHHDFFQKRMEMNQRYMQRMMEQMDSLKNQHFQRQGPSRQQGTERGLPDDREQGVGASAQRHSSTSRVARAKPDPGRVTA